MADEGTRIRDFLNLSAGFYDLAQAAESRRTISTARASKSSSLKAVQTRIGKYGPTELKGRTEQGMLDAGFNVGASDRVPMPTGVNRRYRDGDARHQQKQTD